MIAHLCEKIAIKMTAWEKVSYKRNGYDTPWDTSKPLLKYFKYLKDYKEKTKHNITTSEEEMVEMAIAKMWDSNFLIEDDLMR